MPKICGLNRPQTSNLERTLVPLSASCAMEAMLQVRSHASLAKDGATGTDLRPDPSFMRQKLGANCWAPPFRTLGACFRSRICTKNCSPRRAPARAARRARRARARVRGGGGGGACPVGSGVGGTKKLPQTCPLPQDLLFCVDSIQRLERGLESIIFVEETSAGTLRGRGRVRGSSGLT